MLETETRAAVIPSYVVWRATIGTTDPVEFWFAGKETYLMKRSFRLSFFVMLALVASGLPSAWALTHDNHGHSYDIPLPNFRHAGTASAESELAGTEVSNRFGQTNGGNWHVHRWNPQTGTPSWLYGSGVNVANSLLDDVDAERVARDVIAANPDVFRADNENLRFVSSPTGLGKRAVHFQQTYEGVDVWMGRVHLTFTEAGRLFVMGSDYYSGIDVSPTPSLSLQDAKDIAAGDLPFNYATDTIEEDGQLLILPVSVDETTVKYHLVWRVRVRTESPLGWWMTHVDAHTGEILWRFNEVCFTDFTGNATSDVQFSTYCEDETAEISAHLNLTVSGVGSTTTDANGDWSVSYGGSDNRTVTSSFIGPYIRVYNYNGSESSFSGTATPGVPFTIAWNDANARQDERDTFDAVNDIHDFFQEFDPDWGYVNQQISAYVNRTDFYCPGNAWWDGTINFCAAGGGYGNTGEMQGVVHHEFGHGIQASILGSQGNEGLGEGNSDIMSNFMTQESIIGRGFYQGNCTSGIRNSDNNLQYPEDLNGSVHHDGQIIAGFHWDFLMLMEAQYGQEQAYILGAERWHYGRVLEHPFYQDDQVLATFIADDDDGNLDNGTPHHAMLCEAASNHSYECPEVLIGVFIDHTPVESREEVGDVDVIANIYSYSATLIPDQILLSYQINGGGFDQVIMDPTGNPDEFVGVIPSLTHSSEVGYYLEATDTDNNYASEPIGAPAELHNFVVAPLEAIVEEDAEAGSPDWTHEAASGGFGDQWHLSTTRNHTPAGATSWKCGDTGAGDYASLLDAALVTPTFDLLAYSRLKFWQWIEAEESGAYPGRAYDGGLVEISIDGGAWTQIFPNGGYTHTIREGSTAGPFLEGTDVFSGTVDWHEVVFDLTEFSGSAQLRFRFGSDGADTREGWYVDDVLIEGFLVGYSGIEEQLTRRVLQLSSADPNPFMSRTTLSYSLPEQADVLLQVFDLSGRVVRTLKNETQTAGTYRVEWDGRGDDTRLLPAGVYLTRLRAGLDEVATKVIVAH